MAISQTQLEAALHHTAFVTKTDRIFLRITGSDATRWLNGMVTNSAQVLAPGEGNYNFFLNSQGRIQGDGYLYREHDPAEPAFLLATDAAQRATLQAHLDKFIIMDDVELSSAFEDESSLLLLGPETPALLASLDLPTPDRLRLTHASTPHGAILLLTTQQANCFELRAPASTLAFLHQQLEARHIPPVAPDILEALRILTATPRYGTDIRDRELPQETAQNHALHFSKGCYLGQEIVERIHSRGQVNRVFTALRLQGSLPDLPAALEMNGKSVGEITSAIQLEGVANPEVLAMGYVRREALTMAASNPNSSGAGSPAPGTTLSYNGGTAVPRPVG